MPTFSESFSTIPTGPETTRSKVLRSFKISKWRHPSGYYHLLEALMVYAHRTRRHSRIYTICVFKLPDCVADPSAVFIAAIRNQMRINKFILFSQPVANQQN